MALTKNSYVERVVITLNVDGSFKGASQTRVETITDNGVVLSEHDLAAAPVDITALAQILPGTGALTAQVAALIAERDGLQSQLDVLGAPPKPASEGLPKLILIDRLSAAGLFDAALSTLKADPLQYERWQASNSIDPGNEAVRGLLTAIGGDVDALLAIG